MATVFSMRRLSVASTPLRRQASIAAGFLSSGHWQELIGTKKLRKLPRKWPLVTSFASRFASTSVDAVDVLHQAVVNAGGKCHVAHLGLTARKAGIKKGRLTSFIAKNGDRIALERLENGEYLTHAIAPTIHRFDDPALEPMFHVLYHMTLLCRQRPWPKTILQWETDYHNHKFSWSVNPSELLCALKRGEYVEDSDEGEMPLKWDIARIHDAVNQMPESIREGSSTEKDTIWCQQQTKLEGLMAKSFKVEPNNTPCIVVDNLEALKATIQSDQVLSASAGAKGQYAAVDCEGVPKTLELLQVATASGVYVFDCRTLGPQTVCAALSPLFTSRDHIKLFHDLHRDAAVIQQHGSTELLGVLDTQLVAEYQWGVMLVSLNGFLKNMGMPIHPLKDTVRAQAKAGEKPWGERPIPQQYLQYAALDVSLLIAAATPLSDMISDKQELLLQASEQRLRNAITHGGGLRKICFDVENNYSLASSELVGLLLSEQGFFGEPLQVQCEMEQAISLLPKYMQSKLNLTDQQEGIPDVSDDSMWKAELNDVFLDIDRRAQCWAKGKRHFLSDDSSDVVTLSDLKYITDRLGGFGSDNRAGLNGTLHRFSAMRDRFGEILGISIRIGRHVRGNAAMLMDFLLGTDKSILVLGEPGSGKTTIVREIARILAESKNVVVVDTSNEIAGDGQKPHPCIGLARRMMVPSLEKQSSVLIECVQNHTPECIVIDEIGRPQEVHAARTAKQRGVRLIASAHGDLRNLVKNKELNGLVGGTETVTVGDLMAREESKRQRRLRGQDTVVPISKTKVQRGGDPTFEVVIEVRRGAQHEWRLVADSARAVDSILDLDRYKAQLRTRNAETGEMQMELIDA